MHPAERQQASHEPAPVVPDGRATWKWNRCLRLGAGWQPAWRLPTAAISRQSAGWPIANRPQLAKLPHGRALCLACPYARLPAPCQAIAPASTSVSHTRSRRPGSSSPRSIARRAQECSPVRKRWVTAMIEAELRSRVERQVPSRFRPDAGALSLLRQS